MSRVQFILVQSNMSITELGELIENSLSGNSVNSKSWVKRQERESVYTEGTYISFKILGFTIELKNKTDDILEEYPDWPYYITCKKSRLITSEELHIFVDIFTKTLDKINLEYSLEARDIYTPKLNREKKT